MNNDERKTLADEAQQLKNNPAFQAAILALRQQWHAEQMAITDRDGIFSLAIKMQALEAIPQQLQIFINDQKVAERKKTYG
jgi:inorganic triphosphatase YgiF